MNNLFDASGMNERINKGDLTAIKVHFGEPGNDSFLGPVWVRRVVERVRAAGANPFLTDTNVIYLGGRCNAVNHLNTAISHGFAYSVVGAPIVIADGLKSQDWVFVPVKGRHFSDVKIASGIAQADSMLVLSHFKGHSITGFGGAIKNLGMGCAPISGKTEQHSIRPILYPERCISCGLCAEVCPRSAISFDGGPAQIDIESCAGCLDCYRICPERAMDINWTEEIRPFVERMVEYACGALSEKKDNVGFLNFLIRVCPDCDCNSWSDAPIVGDIGVLASADPVAIDQASYDLVIAESGIEGTCLKRNLAPGKDKFKGLWKHTDGLHQVEYAEDMGLGSRKYRLIRV